MCKFTKILTIFFLVFSIFVSAQNAKCIYVKDGDTATFLINAGSQKLTVRFSAIDAPEMGTKYGQIVKSYVLKRLLYKTVRLRITGIDKYGRTLAHIYIGNKWFQEELLELGYAKHYKYFDSNEILAAKEYKAKKNRLGIWNQ